MARRQDSGSNSAHENQTPNAHNEDTVPERTDTMGRADEDELDDADEEMDGEEFDEEEEDEGSY